MIDLLGGMRVVELTTIVLGPMAGQVLADLGADVIKVEAPAGDLARHVGPRSHEGGSAMFANNNRNKRSIALDLKTGEGREALGRLIDHADVLLHNMRLAAIERLGFGPNAALARNPRLVYCSAIGFGSRGPYAHKPAFDDVIQAASGMAALPAHVGGEPAYVPGVFADKITALYAAHAVMAALIARDRFGHGIAIEVPMMEALASFILSEHLGAATFDDDAAPGYARLFSRHRRPFRTRDGWIAVLPYTEGQWRRALSEIGRDEVAREPWFADPGQRSERTGDLYEILALAMPERDTGAWLEAFERIDVPHSRVSTLSGVLKDEHLAAVRFFDPTDDLPGRARSVAQPVRFEGAPTGSDRAPPALGADGAAVLAEVGYDAARIAELARKGVLGPCDPLAGTA